MITYRKLAGSTDVSVVIRIIDSTDGTPETGVVFNTSGIDLEYRREGAASTDITEATLAALTTAHTDGGFLHIGNGYYRLDLPDAACASGVAGVLVHGTVTGMVVIGCYIDLDPVPADVRQWLGTAAATPTVAGVPEVDVTHWIGTAAATPTVAGVPEVDITHFGGTAGTFASGIPQASLTTSAINGVADQVWDEAASGHVAGGSFGQASNIIRANTAQAGDATHITLDASASATNDFYNNQKIFITAGTGAGQGRIISDYVGATKVAEVATWAVNPSSDSAFVITPFGSIPGASAPTAGEVADAVWDEARTDHSAAGSFGQSAQIIRSGTAQAGAASTITLDASASATNDLYNYSVITIIGGTGAGQSRQITDYVGSSKVATVGLAWATQPSSDSVFLITPLGVDAATVAAIADAVWDEARSGHVTAGSFGEYVLADATRLSGDATAADNAEAFFDGTGYAGTNNVIPTVTTVNGLAANSVTASAIAADAVTEIQSGLATSATQTTLDGKIDTIDTNVDAILADTGTDGVVVAAGSKTGYTLSNTGIDALFTRQLTESYAADGAAPTVAQALMLIQQRMTEFGISSTTLTINKLDGTTAAATLTLNDGSAPTAVTRAT
jgi:hypothetical protein